MMPEDRPQTKWNGPRSLFELGYRPTRAMFHLDNGENINLRPLKCDIHSASTNKREIDDQLNHPTEVLAPSYILNFSVCNSKEPTVNGLKIDTPISSVSACIISGCEETLTISSVISIIKSLGVSKTMGQSLFKNARQLV